MLTKIKLLGFFVFLFGIITVGNIEAQTDNRLNGSWYDVIEGTEIEFIFLNGNFEEKFNGQSFRRGTFTTNSRELTIHPTYIHGGVFNNMMNLAGIDLGLDSKWHTFNEAIIAIRSALLRMGFSEREANEFVQLVVSHDDLTYQYSVDSNSLILVSTLMGESFTVFLKRR